MKSLYFYYARIGNLTCKNIPLKSCLSDKFVTLIHYNGYYSDEHAIDDIIVRLTSK